MRKAPHDPPREQWLARLDVGAGSVGVDPVTKRKRKEHLTIPPASSGSRGWMWVLAPVAKTKQNDTSRSPPRAVAREAGCGCFGVGGVGVDPLVKMKREKDLTIPPASSGSRGWMWVLGVGRVGVDPSRKHLTIPPASSGSRGWMWVLGVGVDPVVVGVVSFSSCWACRCHVTRHPICTP
jgi:hypothetical protein